jgi:hypothetical protein
MKLGLFSYPPGCQAIKQLLTLTLPVIALLVAASALRGAQIEDGFYTALTDQSSPVVATRFGQPVALGEKLQPHITKTQIVSRDNANNQFCAMFTVTNHPSGMDRNLLFVEDGKVYPLEGELDMADHSVLYFPFSGGDAAKAMSQRFGAQVLYRKHPGYNIAVSFTPARTQFEVGEEVPVALRIENVGSSPFTFMHTSSRGPADPNYSFTARLDGKPIEDRSPIFNWGGGSGKRELKPGEVFTNTVNLNKWFVFEKPGEYRVLGSYAMAFTERNEDSPWPWGSAIWQDYASGSFTITIVPAKPR